LVGSFAFASFCVVSCHDTQASKNLKNINLNLDEKLDKLNIIQVLTKFAFDLLLICVCLFVLDGKNA